MKVTGRQGDIPKAYMKANKKEHLEIVLAVSQGLVVTDVTLKQLGAQGSDKPVLRLKTLLYGLKQAG